MPIFLFAAAGALILGGYAMLDEANQQCAETQARRRKYFEAEMLRAELDLDDLRRKAREAGLDPAQVVAGYEALRKGDLSIDQVQQMLRLAS